MARRARRSAWTTSFQRTLGALTRATVRAGTRAAAKAGAATLKRAAKAAADRRKPPTGPGTWSTGIALGGGGARRYQLYKPPRARASSRWPLLVMLHGCSQDALGFARSTRLHRLAAREAFFVLFPEQERLANPQGCWNWYETRSGRALTEAASIVAAIDQACTLYGADPARVAVAGLSAGASMAALLATRYPGRFKAVVMHSGVAPGAAASSATALGAMQGRRRPAPFEGAAGAGLPPLLVIQGTADHIVAASNGRTAASWWAAAMGARAMPPRTLQRGRRYPATVSDFKCGARTVVSLAEVAGLGHAWSGGAPGQAYSDPKGPDASRLLWAFAARQFEPRRGRAQSAAKQ